MEHILIFHSEYSFLFSFCVRVGVAGAGGGGGVLGCGRGGFFLSQAQNIPERINQISNTGLRQRKNMHTHSHANARTRTHARTRSH